MPTWKRPVMLCHHWKCSQNSHNDNCVSTRNKRIRTHTKNKRFNFIHSTIPTNWFPTNKWLTMTIGWKNKIYKACVNDNFKYWRWDTSMTNHCTIVVSLQQHSKCFISFVNYYNISIEQIPRHKCTFIDYSFLEKLNTCNQIVWFYHSIWVVVNTHLCNFSKAL